MMHNRIGKILRDLSSKDAIVSTKEPDWIFIEINPVCKVLIYEYCVKEFAEAIKSEYPASTFFRTENKLFSDAIRETQVLVGWRFPEELLLKAVSLKWIQLISTGCYITQKGNLVPHYLNSDITITNTKGLYSNTVAEYVIWAILTMSRRLHFMLRAQADRNWIQHIGEDPDCKTVGIMGLGSIGRMVAQKAMAFGMKVYTVKRHSTREDNFSDIIERIYPFTDIYTFLNNLDFLVICLPLTSETEGLIGENEFKAMKDSAILINVSRGGIVKQKELTWAIQNKIIGGAVLDVFETEPLPKDSELWALNNVLITPHISGITRNYTPKVGRLFCDNLKRFINGEGPINVIDRAKGY